MSFKIIIYTRKNFFEIYRNLVTRPQNFPNPRLGVNRIQC